MPALLLSLCAALACYLGSVHRHWRLGAARHWRWLALALAGFALGLWVRALGPVAGVMAALTTLMLGWMALPFTALLLGRHR